MITNYAMTAKFSLLEILSAPEIVVVDVGASILEDENERYAPLVDCGGARVIGFEPNEAERAKLEARACARRTFLPYFIGRGGPAIFHETNWVYTGSLLEPNPELLKRFQMLHEVVALTGRHPVETHRLDDLAEVDAMDFLKIDVQGGELAVFEGAQRLLKDCLVIQTEVEFVHIYKEQPLFADVDNFLRTHGFQFHRFLTFGSRNFKPFLPMSDVAVSGSQQLWADAIYVRDFMTLAALTTEQLMKLAVILHDIIASVDMCLFILSELDRRNGGGMTLQMAYLKRLNEHGARAGLSIT